jgi:membrane protein involved in colicin uptake
MSDDTTPVADAEKDAATDQTGAEKETDWKAEAEKWKTLSRKNEERAKAAEPAAKKLAEIEEQQKTELERAQARADAAEASAAKATTDALRAQVALDKKLTPSQAKRLVGATQEELEADADELLADLKNTAPGSAPSSDGQGKQGDVVGQTKQITSRDELKSMSREEKLAAYRDGRLKSLTG